MLQLKLSRHSSQLSPRNNFYLGQKGVKPRKALLNNRFERFHRSFCRCLQLKVVSTVILRRVSSQSRARALGIKSTAMVSHTAAEMREKFILHLMRSLLSFSIHNRVQICTQVFSLAFKVPRRKAASSKSNSPRSRRALKSFPEDEKLALELYFFCFRDSFTS